MILLTSEPKTGKSTAIRKIVHMLGPDNCTGYYTEQVRENGTRTGFMIRTLDGRTGQLADLRFRTGLTVGDYGVDLASFEALCLPEIENALQSSSGRFLIIDEIGPMQLFSEKYKELLYRLLDADIPAIGTIVYRNDEWTSAFKADPRVTLIELTPENRDLIPLRICGAVTGDDAEYQSKVRKAEAYIREPGRFEVQGAEVLMRSTHDTRRIRRDGEGYSCTCEYYSRKGTCSHIMSVLTLKLL